MNDGRTLPHNVTFSKLCNIATNKGDIEMTEGPTPTLQERLIDALERCFERKGMQKTTLGDVAEEAGVSRMTVYRKFKDRRALFAAAALRNMQRQWQRIYAELETIDQLDEWLIECVLLFRRLYSQDATVALYSRIGGHEPGLEVALSDEGLETVCSYFSCLFEKAASENILAPGLLIEDIAEWIHRTNYSLVVHPSPRLQDETDLRRWLSVQVRGVVTA